ncbi:hypothetical protein H9W95_12305 [Flavobacterium lindanitolerans]|nr:hypothetical protein [Flavobacterium lindanitolerans]
MLREFSYKQFGNIEFSKEATEETALASIAEHIKILFIPRKATIQVDFEEFTMETDTLLFINPR